KEAQQYAPGIRILSQEPWEALCSFIISQNNNIPRIKGIIDRLCRQYGEPIGDNLYAFPTAERLSRCTVDDLAPLRSGFRAKYIVDAATKVATNEINLHEIKKMPVEQARKELMKIKGVGPKVADCTMLYGMGKKECFPMDVWMKRAMEVLFPNLTPEDFGTNAGIAQQYIFHYSRMNPQLFEQS
ncbi:MAG: DNA-3-methyladenine glycosylase 2 family protein, partial [Ruminococcus sp.]|nr:DNA-3-methyladenine glycosylase 2 family protein [Ruminococcus sp.]